jgi:hypothetical protein
MEDPVAARQMLEENSWNLEIAVEQMLVRSSFAGGVVGGNA